MAEKSPSLATQAYHTIKENILNLTYPPGMVLTEAMLTKELEMSRSPVRTAIQMLQVEGLIVSDYYKSLRSAGIKMIFAVPGIVVATVFVTFPFISREIIPVLSTLGTDEEEAAALMGANGFTIFRKITFPHIKWALLYGIVLCTARAMGEFGAVSVLSGHLQGKTNTMPLYIELLYQGYDFTGAFAVSAILVCMAVVILVLRSVLEHKGKEA